MALFDVEIAERPGGAQVAISGEIDLSTVADLEQRLDAALRGDTELIVVDLRKVTFLDSSGLRLLLRLDRRQRSSERRLVIVSGPRRVERVFELTGVADELEIVGDPAEISS